MADLRGFQNFGFTGINRDFYSERFPFASGQKLKRGNISRKSPQNLVAKLRSLFYILSPNQIGSGVSNNFSNALPPVSKRRIRWQ